MEKHTQRILMRMLSP